MGSKSVPHEVGDWSQAHCWESETGMGPLCFWKEGEKITASCFLGWLVKWSCVPKKIGGHSHGNQVKPLDNLGTESDKKTKTRCIFEPRVGQWWSGLN